MILTTFSWKSSANKQSIIMISGCFISIVFSVDSTKSRVLRRKERIIPQSQNLFNKPYPTHTHKSSKISNNNNTSKQTQRCKRRVWMRTDDVQTMREEEEKERTRQWKFSWKLVVDFPSFFLYSFVTLDFFSPLLTISSFLCFQSGEGSLVCFLFPFVLCF